MTNLIIENVRRVAEKKRIIPLFFMIGITGNPYNNLSEMIASNDKGYTVRELRRAFKICEHYDLGDYKKIRNIAKKTIVFVKLKKEPDRTYSVVRCKVPWEREGFEELWKKREMAKVARRKIHKFKHEQWRPQVHFYVNADERGRSLPWKDSSGPYQSSQSKL